MLRLSRHGSGWIGSSAVAIATAAATVPLYGPGSCWPMKAFINPSA